MIWIIMMNVFIVAAGAGGDRWLMKTIMRMVLFFLFVAVAERMGAVFAAGIVFTAAWAALSLFEAETKKKRHANKVRQCRVRENINRTIQIEQ